MADGMNIDDLTLVTNAKDPDQIAIMTIEEMAELTQILTKILRTDNTTKTPKELYSKLVEEYSDVILMLAELMIAFNIDGEESFDIINFKMDRWLKRNGLRDVSE